MSQLNVAKVRWERKHTTLLLSVQLNIYHLNLSPHSRKGSCEDWVEKIFETGKSKVHKCSVHFWKELIPVLKTMAETNPPRTPTPAESKRSLIRQPNLNYFWIYDAIITSLSDFSNYIHNDHVIWELCYYNTPDLKMRIVIPNIRQFLLRFNELEIPWTPTKSCSIVCQMPFYTAWEIFPI